MYTGTTIEEQTRKEITMSRGERLVVPKANKSSWLRSTAWAGAFALSLTACGGTANSEPSPTSAVSPVDTTISPNSEKPNLTFDYLGGGSTIVRVYAGFGEKPEDKVANGTFNDGDVVPAVCKTDGRTIHSHPELGEENRASNQWIKIVGTPGATQYATAVYTEDPAALLAILKKC